MFADKLRLALSVGTLAVAADMARLGTVSRVNQDYGHACPSGLVLHKLPKLKETPVAKSSPETPRSRLLTTVTQTGEVLQSDTDAECLGFADKTLADGVVYPCLIAGLPPRHPLQPSLGRLGSFPLVLLTGCHPALAVSFDTRTGERFPGGVGSNLDNAKVTTQVFGNRLWVGNGRLDLNMQKVTAIAFDKCSAGRNLPRKRGSLKVAKLGRQSMPPMQQGQAESPVGFSEGKDSSIVVHARRSKSGEVFYGGNATDGTNGQIRRQPERSPRFAVGQFVQSEMSFSLCLCRTTNQVIARRSESHKCNVDFNRLFSGRNQLATDGTDGFHSDTLLVLDVLLDNGQRRAANSRDKVGVRPERWQPATQRWVLRAQEPGRTALDQLYQPVDSELWIDFNEQMYVIGHHFHLDQFRTGFKDHFPNQILEPFINAVDQDLATILGAENNVVLAAVGHVVIALEPHSCIIHVRDVECHLSSVDSPSPFLPMPEGRGFLETFHEQQSQILVCVRYCVFMLLCVLILNLLMESLVVAQHGVDNLDDPDRVILVLKTITYRLYPSREQESFLFYFLYIGRKIYNDALAERVRFYKDTGKSLTKFTQQMDLTIRRSISPVLASVPVWIERDSLSRIDKAFANFFRRVNEGSAKPGFPRFKSANRWNSFSMPIQGSGKKLVQGNRIRVAGIEGTMPSRGGQQILGKIIVQRIVHRAGKWFCKFVVDDKLDPPPIHPVKSAIGVDVGLKSFATLSNGSTIENPRFYRGLELKRAHRNVSRKIKGSRNRWRAVRRLQSVYEKVRNLRHNFTHHESKRIVNDHQLIVVEKLNIAGMARSRFAKSILDAAWGRFIFQLRYKAENAGCAFVEVDPRGTSQDCSKCGQTVPKKLSDRVHKCSCGLVLDRDHNAALNILQRAVRSAPGPGRWIGKACGEATKTRRNTKASTPC
jgi:putative transposase